MVEENTDLMIVCNRFTCQFNCEEKQNFCVAGCIHIDASGKCNTYQLDKKKAEEIMREIRKEKLGDGKLIGSGV